MAAIHWAARSGHTAAVELLLKIGATADAGDRSASMAASMSASMSASMASHACLRVRPCLMCDYAAVFVHLKQLYAGLFN